jgi:heme exporter protein C
MRRALLLLAAAACAALFAYTPYRIFYATPIEKESLFIQKVFYYHVPCAFVLFVAVIVCGAASLIFLRQRAGRYDDVAEAAGEIAVLFGLIVLVSGSIWGRAAWGTWWQWDARLTSSLLLWMVMLGYVLVRKYGGTGSERLAAGLAVFAMADVPLIYFSVKIWQTHHPPTAVVPSLTGSMRVTLWLCVLLFALLFVILLVARVGHARARRRLREAREMGLDAGLFE